MHNHLHVPPSTEQPPLLRLADIQETPLKWLWPGRIALGKLNLLVGPSGLGKSCIALDIAARFSAPLPWPGEPSAKPTPGGSVLLADEASLADTVIPRLKAARADLDRINAVTSLSHDPLRPQTLLGSPRVHDLSRLEAAVQNTPDCRLVLIDPIFRTGHYSVAVGQTGTSVTLAPLCRLAAKHKFALLAIVPLRNLVSANAVLDAVNRLPSHTVAATIWGVTPDRYEPGRRFLLPLKSTVTHKTPPLAYRIVSADKTPQTPRVEWEDQPINISADEAFDFRETLSERRDAARWLEIALADGAVRASSLLQQAAANGFSSRSARSALDTLRGVRFRKGFGGHGAWYWALNEDQAEALRSEPKTSEEYLEDFEENHQAILEDIDADLHPYPR